jgi:hypothetical protein
MFIIQATPPNILSVDDNHGEDDDGVDVSADADSKLPNLHGDPNEFDF